jgi:hypothetical protein
VPPKTNKGAIKKTRLKVLMTQPARPKNAASKETHVFRQEAGGTVHWINFADTLSEAFAKVRAAMAADNVSYIIVNSEMSEKTGVAPG